MSLDQLDAISLKDGESLPAWTVAYSSRDEPLEPPSSSPTTLETELRQELSNPTKFDALLRAYLQSLPETQEGHMARNHIDRDPEIKYIRHGDIFLPDQRALAVGKVTQPRLEEMIQGNILRPTQDLPYGLVSRQTMSGYFGCSGGMVCIFKNGDVEKPKVIGICSLLHHSPTDSSC